jgi:hypothetical protein
MRGEGGGKPADVGNRITVIAVDGVTRTGAIAGIVQDGGPSLKHTMNCIVTYNGRHRSLNRNRFVLKRKILFKSTFS